MFLKQHRHTCVQWMLVWRNDGGGKLGLNSTQWSFSGNRLAPATRAEHQSKFNSHSVLRSSWNENNTRPGHARQHTQQYIPPPFHCMRSRLFSLVICLGARIRIQWSMASARHGHGHWLALHLQFVRWRRQTAKLLFCEQYSLSKGGGCVCRDGDGRVCCARVCWRCWK